MKIFAWSFPDSDFHQVGLDPIIFINDSSVISHMTPNENLTYCNIYSVDIFKPLSLTIMTKFSAISYISYISFSTEHLSFLRSLNIDEFQRAWEYGLLQINYVSYY